MIFQVIEQIRWACFSFPAEQDDRTNRIQGAKEQQSAKQFVYVFW